MTSSNRAHRPRERRPNLHMIFQQGHYDLFNENHEADSADGRGPIQYAFGGFNHIMPRLHDEPEKDEELGEMYLGMIKKMKIGKSSKNCAVCLNNLEKGSLLLQLDDIIRSLPCQHMFHNSCIKAWFKKKSICPLCRMDIKKHLCLHGQNY